MAQKAIKPFQILDATSYNNPIDNNHIFYTDFSGLRKDFNIKTLYKRLNILDDDCNPLSSPKKLFLRGHRGTGKTSELLSLKNKIKDTKCYFVVFSDLSNGKLDPQNIEIVDILILLLEDLVVDLENDGATIPEDILRPFYDWYAERIKEVNTDLNESAHVQIEAEVGLTIPFFSKLLTKTTGKLTSSNTTKEKIRTVFTNKISDFMIKFNEFILSIKEEFKKIDKYHDILFIVDGFEKIGELDDRKKVLIDNSEQFNKIEVNMLITLPIELHEYEYILNSFANIISFPLITLDDNANVKLKEFITKRIDIDLFDNEKCIDKIIKYGAGSPRETLRIIQESYALSESNLIDDNSITKAIIHLGKSYSTYLEEKEIEILKKILKNEHVPFGKECANLLNEKVLLEYGDENYQINPMVLENKRIKQLLTDNE